MTDERDLQQIKDDLQRMDDGSIEYEETYSLFSWFLQKFKEFDKYRQRKTSMAKL